MINIVVGLPGSGKTTLLNEIARNDPNAIIFDDITKNDEDRLLSFSGDSEIWVSSPSFCVANTMQNFIRLVSFHNPDHGFKIHRIDVSIDECWRRIQERADDRKISRSYLDFLNKEFQNDQR